MATKPRHQKTAIQLWVGDNRKRLELSSADLAIATGLSEDTARAWESRGRPGEDAIQALERLFGRPRPSDDVGRSDAPESALLAALTAQTAAINGLIERLDLLASSAIRDGVLDALREAGLGPDAGASPSSPPDGPLQ